MSQAERVLGLSGVVAALGASPGKALPPVHLWNPAHCGDIDIVIKPNGLWVHEGSPIGREGLVRLFSTILRKDPDGFYLVTPVEKLKITVEDAPFIATRVDQITGDDGVPVLRFVTNVGDEVDAGPDHPIRISCLDVAEEPRPYIHIRGGLEALIARPVFYELAGFAQERAFPGGAMMAVESGGAWFPLGVPERES